MPFYYLHKTDSEKPRDKCVDMMDYVCYNETELDAPVILPTEPNDVLYCPHEVDGIIRWQPNDNVVTTEGNLNTVKATFNKVHEIVGFTLWKKV